MVDYFNRPSVSSFMRANEEFEARKRAQAMQEQLQQSQLATDELKRQGLQKKIEMGLAPDSPAEVQAYQFFSGLSPEEQAKYLQLKRAQQTLNLGGSQAVLDPFGGIQTQYLVTPKITETPSYMGQQAGAQSQAKLEQQLQYEPRIAQETSSVKSRSAKETELGELEATMPQLMDTVAKLSELGKEATYTYTGRAGDVLRGELAGLTGIVSPSQGAIARKEYISLVDNQILPLLRQTFGAQFTEREGQSLKATLGDPNATPEEKDAVLRSFIDQKMQTIQTKRRELGHRAPPQDALPVIEEQPQGTGERIIVINPNTGEQLEIDAADLDAARQEGFMRR